MSALPIDPERDYAGEIRVLVDSEFADGDAAPIVAARIVDKLTIADPDLLRGWLEAHAVALLTQEIRMIDVRRRQHVRSTASRGVFGAAARSSDADMSGFLSLRYVVNEEGERYHLAAMKADDLVFVASGYEDTSRRAQLEAAFFRALAKKVGKKTVGDCFTEEQIRTLRGSLGVTDA